MENSPRLNVIYLLPESGGRLPDGSRVLLQEQHRKDRSDGYSKYLSVFEPQACERMTLVFLRGLGREGRSQRKSWQNRIMGTSDLVYHSLLSCKLNQRDLLWDWKKKSMLIPVLIDVQKMLLLWDPVAQNFQKRSLAEETTSSIMFTPVESAIGGMMIGLSAALSYMVDGKIAGIAGLLGPFLRGVTQCQPLSGGQLWKLLFLMGLVIGGLIAMIFNEDFSFPGAAPFHIVRYIAAGIFVGIGTRVGRGCTSGHGICGLPRFSSRSWVAVPTFMGVAVGTVALTRHAFNWDNPASPGVAEIQWPPKWQFPLASLCSSIVLAVILVFLPQKIRTFASPLVCGTIFGVGLSIQSLTESDCCDLCRDMHVSCKKIPGLGFPWHVS